MYVVREKKSKTILHMVNSRPGEHLKPEEVFPGFDPKTMELGRSEEQYIPAKFTIENGKVKSLEPEAATPAPKVKEPTAAEELASLKEAKLAEINRQSFDQRMKLIPDHEIQNAALGIYDEKRTSAIRETVKAFRDEYKRLEATIKKARSKKELESLEASFPTKLAAPRKGD
jgi:hypothetical protein